MGRRKILSNEKSPKPIQTLREIFSYADFSSYENTEIKNLPFNNRVKNQLQENNCNTLGELLNYSAPELLNLRNIGKSSIDNILAVLKEYCNSKNFQNSPENTVQQKNSESETLKTLAAEIMNSICKDKRQFDILCARANGRILKSIGKEYGCTRERIRQIEHKAVERFSEFCHFKVEKFLILMKSEIGEKNFITLEDLKNVVDETSAKIFLLLFSKSNWQKDFFYDEITKKIIVPKEKNNPVDYEILLAQLPDFISEEDLQIELEKISNGEKAVEDSLRIRVSKKYRRSGKFWHKNWLSLNFQCGYILKNFFKDGYKIYNKADYNNFMQVLRENFGENIYMTQRALDAKISTFVGVLCARGKYMHPDFIQVPTEVLKTIKNFIDNTDRNAFLYKEIFELLKDKLAGTQITNHYFLQGIIKYYKLPYILKKDQLTKKDEISLLTEFNAFVKERGKVSLNEIKKYFVGLEYSNIMLAVKASSEVIFIGNGCYLHVEKLNLREKDFTDIEKQMRQLCQNSPVSSRYIFDFFKEHFAEFLSRNRIEDGENLYGILKFMFKDKFNFTRPYIFIDAASQGTHKKILLKYFEDTDKITIAQLLKFCDENKIRYIAKNYLIESLKPEFILIDKGNLIRPEKIGVTAKIIVEVVKTLKVEIDKNGGWIAARKFNFELLPPLKIAWNSFLFESVVALSDDLKIFHSTVAVTGFSSAVFVSEKFSDYKFEEFLLKVLIDEHNRRPFKNYEEILSWLQDNGLCNLTIPKFLFRKHHLSFDTVGKIILK